MKRLLIAILFLSGTIAVRAQDGGAISDQQFYDELNPYGTWVNYPQYGYVWEPNMDQPENFTPYSTHGRWVYTDEGWTWVSDYPWGWATFHYGRWFYDDYVGWLWIPGYEWAPAWVTWGSYGGNYGWAPLGPGISISVGLGWRPPRSNWWTFVPCNHFGEDHWHNYVVRNNTTIINHVTIINNVHQGGGRPGQWNGGPRREEVERFGNRHIQPMTFNNAQRPGTSRVQNNSIALYRPVVNRNPQGAPVRPTAAQPFNKVRPANRLPMNHNAAPANNPGNNPGNRPGNHPGNNPGNRPGNNPGNNPGNRPGDRPVNPAPANPGNQPGRPGNQHDRPVNPNPATRPNNPRPNNPAPNTRPNNPAPQRPMNNPPAMPHNNRPVNPNPNPVRPQPTRPAAPPMQQHMNPPQQRPQPMPQRPNNPPQEHHHER